MFLLNEWHDLSFSTKMDVQIISKLVYQGTCWEGMEELCAIGKPSLKVLYLVDGDKPAVGYLYEAKEVINANYEDMGDEVYGK